MRAKLVSTKNPNNIPKILRKKSKEVRKITPEIFELVEKMIAIMNKNNGVGISAVQVGVPIRLIVVKNCDEYYVLVNPEIISFSKKEVVYAEGCLSFPGIFREISRPERIKVRAGMLDGKTVELEAEDLVARTMEHEIDHLEGVVFLDHVQK